MTIDLIASFVASHIVSAISNYFFHCHSLLSLYSKNTPLGTGSSPGRVTRNFIPGGSEPFMILF